MTAPKEDPMKELKDFLDLASDNAKEAVAVMKPALEAAIRIVEGWEARAAHMVEYAKTIPEEVRESIEDSAAEMKNKSDILRYALNEAYKTAVKEYKEKSAEQKNN